MTLVKGFYESCSLTSEFVLVVLVLVLHALEYSYSVLNIFKDLTVSRDSIAQKTDEEADNTDEHQDGHEEEHLYVTAADTEVGDSEEVDTDSKTDKEEDGTERREESHRLIHDERSGDYGCRTLHISPHAGEKS